jgi:cell wall-associated NlpC family hydrolase
MKKKLTILFIVFIFIVLCISPVAQASDLLRLGSTGSEVVQLQTKLNYIGYNAGSADGIFGYKTQTAVRAFQSAKSLAPDGIVGPLTQSALNNAYNAKTRIAKANDIVYTGKKYIGYPYKWGGSSPAAGFDCSGFTQYVFAQNGITLPRISRDQYNVGSWISYNNLLPGDLVFFSINKNGIVDHVGIYIGNGQFINASSSKGVTVYSFGSYWNSVYLGAKRLF